MTDFETEIRVYKARYQATDRFFSDLLGVDPSTFIQKKKGRRAFTPYELFQLSDALQIDPRTLYEMLPEVNRTPTSHRG